MHALALIYDGGCQLVSRTPCSISGAATLVEEVGRMIPYLLDIIAALNASTLLFSACLATGIFMLLPRRL
jgi:hypothetical protein